MRRLTILSIAFVLLLIALPLISIGATNGPALLWQLGFVLLLIGLLTPPALRLLRRTIQDERDEPDVGEEPT
jgi:hypothetical protein